MPISGSKVNSGRGYDTFQPNALQQIEKELDLSNLYQAISGATWALGQLNALNILLPNPELLIEKYALKEALLSSQIEGTQSTMVEILQNENNNNDDIKGFPATDGSGVTTWSTAGQDLSFCRPSGRTKPNSAPFFCKGSQTDPGAPQYERRSHL